jgi:hypothetical protein
MPCALEYGNFTTIRISNFVRMLRLTIPLLLLAVSVVDSDAFFLPSPTTLAFSSKLFVLDPRHPMNDDDLPRRSFLSSIIGGGFLLSGLPALADDDESFASIAARAALLSSDVGEKMPLASPKSDDPRTAYNFSLPVAGEILQFQDIVHQQYSDDGRAKVKAILVINMKEDDPIARKDIPELISLASK